AYTLDGEIGALNLTEAEANRIIKGWTERKRHYDDETETPRRLQEVPEEPPL
ncbi:hypothetical protein LCGC14_3079290, partial [marine sediment metagenome]